MRHSDSLPEMSSDANDSDDDNAEADGLLSSLLVDVSTNPGNSLFVSLPASRCKYPLTNPAQFSICKPSAITRDQIRPQVLIMIFLSSLQVKTLPAIDREISIIKTELEVQIKANSSKC